MKCFNCVYFTGNDLLSCAVNPSHCEPTAEACKEFEMTHQPMQIQTGDYHFFFDQGVYQLAVYGYGEMLDLYDSETISEKEVLLLLLERDNIAVKKFLENCSL